MTTTRQLPACPGCGSLLLWTTDPIVRCGTCRLELAVVRVADVDHVFERHKLVRGDELTRELDRLAQAAEERRR